MKIARLPDGQMVEFPDDIPDDEMDRVVRQKMGVAEPVEFEALAAEMMQQMVALQQALIQTVERQDQMTMALAQMIEAQTAPRRKTVVGPGGKRFDVTEEIA